MTQREARRVAKWHTAQLLKSSRLRGWPFSRMTRFTTDEADRINEELDKLVDRLYLQSMKFVTAHAEELQEGEAQ